jgi:hypothetical protein
MIMKKLFSMRVRAALDSSQPIPDGPKVGNKKYEEDH